MLIVWIINNCFCDIFICILFLDKKFMRVFGLLFLKDKLDKFILIYM